MEILIDYGKEGGDATALTLRVGGETQIVTGECAKYLAYRISLSNYQEELLLKLRNKLSIMSNEINDIHIKVKEAHCVT